MYRRSATSESTEEVSIYKFNQFAPTKQEIYYNALKGTGKPV